MGAADAVGAGACMTVAVVDPETGAVRASRYIHVRGSTKPAGGGSGSGSSSGGGAAQCTAPVAGAMARCGGGGGGAGPPCCEALGQLGAACLGAMEEAMVAGENPALEQSM